MKMKFWLFSTSLWRFAIIVALSLLVVVAVMSFWKFAGSIGGDFDMRYNEVLCVLDGKDPYLIWSGREVSNVYYAGKNTPAGKMGTHSTTATKKVDIYTPWEYTFFLPFSLLSERFASFVWTGFCILSLVGMGWTAFQTGKAIHCDTTESLFCLTAVLTIAGKGLNACLATQNFPIVFAGLLFLMVFSLKRNRQFTAGIIWAVLLSKPQTAALLFFPLFFCKRWKTIFCACCICLLASLPPAILTKTPPWTLFLHLSEMESIISSTPFLPDPFFTFVSIHVGHGVASLISAAVGMAICIAASWKLKGNGDWRRLLAVAVLCSLGWTYKRGYDYCLIALPLLIMAEAFLRYMRSKNGTISFVSLFCLIVLPWVPKHLGIIQCICLIIPIVWIVWDGTRGANQFATTNQMLGGCASEEVPRN